MADMRGFPPAMALVPYQRPYTRARSLGRPVVYPGFHAPLRLPHRRILPFPERALVAYLPMFTARHFRRDQDLERCLADWTAHSRELRSNGWNRLREEDLLDAVYLTLEALQTNDYDDGSVSRRLLDRLDESLEDDRLSNGALREKTTPHSHRLFRSMAELSHVNRSRPIATVLRTFFVTRVEFIAHRNYPKALVQWCQAINRAYMRDEDMIECFEALLVARPKLISELLDERGDKARELAEVLASVAIDAGRSDLLPGARVFGLRRPGRLQSRDSEEQLRRLKPSRDELKYIRQLEATVDYYRDAAAEMEERGRLLELNMGEKYERRLLTSGTEYDDRRRLRILDDSTLADDRASVVAFSR